MHCELVSDFSLKPGSRIFLRADDASHQNFHGAVLADEKINGIHRVKSFVALINRAARTK
jgi:hypothetical protein